MPKKKPRTKKDLAFRTRLRRDPFGRLSLALVDYLDSVGWRALIVGEPRVQQQPLERAFNYEFVMRFTGGRNKGDGSPARTRVTVGETAHES